MRVKNGRGCRPHHPPAERLASRPTRLPELYAAPQVGSRPPTDNTHHRSLDAHHFGSSRTSIAVSIVAGVSLRQFPFVGPGRGFNSILFPVTMYAEGFKHVNVCIIQTISMRLLVDCRGPSGEACWESRQPLVFNCQTGVTWNSRPNDYSFSFFGKSSERLPTVTSIVISLSPRLIPILIFSPGLCLVISLTVASRSSGCTLSLTL